MKYCPITYEIIKDNQLYSQAGLRLLSPQLKNLKPLDLTADEQRREAIARAGKMSIQGVQTKLSAQLKIKKEMFQIVDKDGRYILKTQSEHYPELPENEAISMTMAAAAGIEVPLHGLLYAKDDSMTYFIKRFDRAGHTKKLAVEDFTQLAELDRETKYNSSIEKVIKIIEQFCSFPKIEYPKLFRLLLFNFLIGNEDMHLKNFSLITRGEKITLSPAYDLLNTSIATPDYREEIALPLNGKKNQLKRRDFLEYLAREKLGLNQVVIDEVLADFRRVIPQWEKLLKESFLSPGMKKKYLALLQARQERLGF